MSTLEQERLSNIWHTQNSVDLDYVKEKAKHMENHYIGTIWYSKTRDKLEGTVTRVERLGDTEYLYIDDQPYQLSTLTKYFYMKEGLPMTKIKTIEIENEHPVVGTIGTFPNGGTNYYSTAYVYEGKSSNTNHPVKLRNADSTRAEEYTGFKTVGFVHKENEFIIVLNRSIISLLQNSEVVFTELPENYSVLEDFFPFVERYIEAQKIEDAKKEKIIEKGRVFKPVEPTSHKQEEINVSGNTTQDQFISIVGNLSKLSEEINQAKALGDAKEELEKAFLDAKTKLQGVSAVKKPGTVVRFLDSYLDNKWTNNMVQKASESKAKSESVQSNIDYLFGLVHEKFEELVLIGENLQASENQMSQKIEALRQLEQVSNEEIAPYDTPVKTPIKLLILNTQIKQTIEKYEMRLLKVEGAVLATQSTILALGKDLPTLKSDLTEEMAIGSLLGSVDDYQKMYTNIKELVAAATNDTAESTHQAIENLMNIQINDTHTTEYIAASVKRGENFAKMVQDKSGKLRDKVVRDATFISEVARGTSIEDARETIKKIEG